MTRRTLSISPYRVVSAMQADPVVYAVTSVGGRVGGDEDVAAVFGGGGDWRPYVGVWRAPVGAGAEGRRRRVAGGGGGGEEGSGAGAWSRAGQAQPNCLLIVYPCACTTRYAPLYFKKLGGSVCLYQIPGYPSDTRPTGFSTFSSY